ncbi:MAG: hypothetical protein SH859_02260, partial [Hyphomicrobium aestuarii]|nr:hypothetical protein [Hyphomicrobium aestuarii]
DSGGADSGVGSNWAAGLERDCLARASRVAGITGPWRQVSGVSGEEEMSGTFAAGISQATNT